MVNSTDFAKRLEKILEYYGLTATAFSEKIAFNRSTMSHLLSGRNKPSLEFVLKVVETFSEVNLYWLLNGKGSFPSTDEHPKPTTGNFSNHENVVEFPSAKNRLPEENVLKSPSGSINSDQTTVERIVIFYSDGTFKEYLP